MCVEKVHLSLLYCFIRSPGPFRYCCTDWHTPLHSKAMQQEVKVKVKGAYQCKDSLTSGTLGTGVKKMIWNLSSRAPGSEGHACVLCPAVCRGSFRCCRRASCRPAADKTLEVTGSKLLDRPGQVRLGEELVGNQAHCLAPAEAQRLDNGDKDDIVGGRPHPRLWTQIQNSSLHPQAAQSTSKSMCWGCS